MSENKTHNTNNERLEDISSLLAGIKRENPFRVPENYFDELPEKIRIRLEQDGAKAEGGIRLKTIKPLFYITSAAASILIFLSVWFFVKRDQEMSDAFTGISFETLMNESPELIEYMDEHSLIDVLLVNSTEAIDFGDVSLDLDSNLTNEDIYDYLYYDEEISNELLYNL
ncbi:MAG: hypothetical protein R2750_05125 [Bacteroidales bacterium]